MKLVEAGKLSLDQAVTEIVPGLPQEWKAITVKHLLTHTSGLPEMNANPRYLSLPEEKRKSLSLREAISYVAELPLKSKPGETFSYHRAGYNLLGLIVEVASGRPFADFLHARVFAPLGMESTRFGDSEAVVKGRPPTAYNRDTGELRNWVYTFGYGNPGSGLNSSAADLARFFAALQAGKLLRKESLAALWTPVTLNDGTEKNYSLGWSLSLHGGRRVVGHEGGGAAWVAHFPDEQLSIILLANLNGARADEIQYGIADIFLRK